MTYVMSDLHGMYRDYCAMLQKIALSENDTLFILGDICDRGPESAELYLDIMSRKNIHCIRGNHEEMLLDALPLTFGYLLQRNGRNSSNTEYGTESWCACGGDVTRESFLFQNRKSVERIYSYIASLPLYRSIQIGHTEYVFVHAGLENFTPERPLGSYSADEMVWYSPDFDEMLWPGKNRHLIVGHVPTIDFLPGNEGKIYHGKGNISVIDCGAPYRKDGGRLGCLCLETKEEYYV